MFRWGRVRLLVFGSWLWAGLSSAILVGCPGALSIDLGAEVAADDDDDEEALVLDLSALVGVEFLNVRWDPTLAADGQQDCAAEWSVSGVDDGSDDDNTLCPSCDQVWQVTFVAQPGAEECLGGPSLPFEAEYVRKIGLEFDDASDVHFRWWRNIASAEEPLLYVGIGAVDSEDATFSWSGESVYSPEGDFGAHLHYYSGEGEFVAGVEGRSGDAR
ncbi:MAG TPA: hypothetical protein DIU15_19565 [Deltaproteobacteria bacterium]|nr:hypothetical protein [Deltaproteobacteria bacterium]